MKQAISTTKVPLRNDRNEIFGVVGVSRDITERKLAYALRDGQAQILEMIAMSAPLVEVLARLVRLAESQFKGTFGSILLLDEASGQLRIGAAPSLPESYTRAIDGTRIGPKAGSCGTAAHRREVVVVADIMSDPLWSDCREPPATHGLRACWSRPILSHQGGVLGTFAMYAKEVRKPTAAEMDLVDIATRIAGIAIERKHAEDRIHFMANHDVLTGLPNRALLQDRLSQALLRARRYERWVTVLFVDLDNFKLINDSLGHSAGDELLKTFAKRMVSCVRATDTVVRLGGDEFVVVLPDQPRDPDAVSEVVQKIQAVLGEPIRLEGHNLTVTSSIGIANYPDDGADADALMANADAAMYRAKEIGRDNFQFYTPELNTKVHGKFLLQEELRNAVVRSEFVLHYQPQVDLRTGRVFAVEALIRWNHPRLGLVPPLKFIPIAEETGLISPIGEWVLREACRQNKAWQDAGLPPMAVSVNVSARQFKEKSLIGRVVGALKESGLEARYLELELTESLIMQDIDLAVATMKDLQILGVRLSIDDFGTGYSSLSALKTFPVTRLKIDKSFVDGLLADENDRAVASAIISLGQKLNLRVIAEGVETEAQAAFLRDNNCDEMQGYLFSRPLPAERVEKLLGGPTPGEPSGSALSPAPAFVSVDWGTSAFRARLTAADGAPLDVVEAEVGAVDLASGAHEAFAETQIGGWTRRFPGLPVVMSGMVGSRQGWVEAPYVPCPAGAAEIAAAMTTLSATRIGRVFVVPGISGRDQRDAPDVMRGEETQILGALAASGRADGLFVLPGTHSKWARVEGGRIVDFATFMTGEIFAALKDHTILGRLMAPATTAASANDGFARGLAAAAALERPGDLLHAVFMARTLGLLEELPAPAAGGISLRLADRGGDARRRARAARGRRRRLAGVDRALPRRGRRAGDRPRAGARQLRGPRADRAAQANGRSVAALAERRPTRPAAASTRGWRAAISERLGERRARYGRFASIDFGTPAAGVFAVAMRMASPAMVASPCQWSPRTTLRSAVRSTRR